MKIYKLIFSMLLLSMFTFTSCVWKQAATHVAIKKKAFTAQVTSVSTANNQFTLTGSNLDQVKTVKLKDGSSESLFEIVSQSGSQIVVNSLANISVAAGKMLEFIIADAYSAATFSVNFSLCDSTLNGKLLDCSIVANDRDVLSYDGVSQTWKPRNVNGLYYLGVYLVTGLVLEASLPAAANGDYYVVSGVGGTFRPNSGADIAIASGDWITFSDNGTWQVVKTLKNGVASFNGRIGAVVPKEADYTLAQMSDVKYTVAPVDKYVLSYSAADSAWIPSATLPASTVTTTSIAAGTIAGGTTTAGVTTGNIAQNTIVGGPTGNIAATTITNTEISATAAIDLSKLAALPGTFAGVPVGTQAILVAGNTVQAALEQLALIPTDYVSKNYLVATQTLAGKYSFTSDVFIADPVTAIGTEAVNINYVTAYVDTFGKWIKGAGGVINYAGGKVGIGTANPDGMLDVVSAGATAAELYIGHETGGAGDRAVFGFNNVATPFAYWQTTGTAPIILQSNGNSVGIGMTPLSPATYKLEVGGEINATGVRVNGVAVGSSQWLNAGGDISYSVVNGKVGVGTAAPNSLLHVNGPIATAVKATIDTYTILATDSVILATPTVGTIYTLPTPIGIAGRQYTIKNLSAFTITVTPAVGLIWATTSSAANYALTTGKTMTVVSNNTDWYIISLF